MAEPIIEYHFSYATAALKLRQSHVVDGPLDLDINEVLNTLGKDSFPKFERLEWPAWAWPGGYPLYYVTADCGVLCPKCANDNLELTLGGEKDWRIVSQEINYEEESLCCDHCNAHIESAYGEGGVEP